MPTTIDLSAVPVVDNHCHAINRDQNITTEDEWRRLFTEDPGMESFVPGMLSYRRVMRRLATLLVSSPTEAALLRARTPRLAARLWRAANIDTLVLDTGFPPGDRGLTPEQMAEASGARVVRLLRLEILMQDLIKQHDTLEAVEEALRTALADIRASGYVGLKSIVAYRTGLRIRRWGRKEAEDAFRRARSTVAESGSVRLAHKPLLDTLLLVAFTAAAEQQVPVQFHTGYGDRDVDLLLADPLHLRAILEDRAFLGMPVILLHKSYPYTRQAAYLAAVYPYVYLDLSYGIPFLSYRAMVTFTQDALGAAPASKLLYSSDATGVPEIYWCSALDGRRAIGEALAGAVADGEVTAAEAERMGIGILRDNAIRLYDLKP